ncbi:hypothetical protein DID88_001797 [Monilinia fructigena]|uniref:Uncharacterized protein n=1 Tax=Monilinia fructigena TaxID=38457 RepID=A0A395IXP5_9HELO|nr:hypothetical protein DID88_001797 [Monilinia fructigena]
MISRVNVKRSSQLGAAFRKTPESLLNPVSNADSDEDEESGYASSESDYFEAKSGYTSSEPGESPSESDYFASESGYTSSESENFSSDSNNYASESGYTSSESENFSSDSNNYASESGDSSSDSDDSSSDSKDYASESEDSPSDSGSICSTSTGSTLPSRQLPPPHHHHHLSQHHHHHLNQHLNKYQIAGAAASIVHSHIVCSILNRPHAARTELCWRRTNRYGIPRWNAFLIYAGNLENDDMELDLEIELEIELELKTENADAYKKKESTKL